MASTLDNNLVFCKCSVCSHEKKLECISEKCGCCDLEDAFSLLTHVEFER